MKIQILNIHSQKIKVIKSTKVKKTCQSIIYYKLGVNEINNNYLRLYNRIKIDISNYKYIMDILYKS